MRRILPFVSLFIFLVSFLFLSKTNALAFSCSISPNPVVNDGSSQNTAITFFSPSIKKNQTYTGAISKKSSTSGTCSGSLSCLSNSFTAADDGSITITWSSTALDVAGYGVTLQNQPSPGDGLCMVDFNVTSSGSTGPTTFCSSVTGASCYKYDCPTGYKSVSATCTGIDYACCTPSSNPVSTCELGGGTCTNGRACDDSGGHIDTTKTCASGAGSCCMPAVAAPPPPPATTDCSSSSICCNCHSATATLTDTSTIGTPNWICTDPAGKRYSPTVLPACGAGQTCNYTTGCVSSSANPKSGPNPYNNFPVPTIACSSLSGNGGCNSISTALGVIGTNLPSFVASLFGLVLTLSGAIAVLLIIISGYRIITSQGNPEKLQGAREQLTAAVVGLLFVIFSLFILELIGVDILNLPGFGK